MKLRSESSFLFLLLQGGAEEEERCPLRRSLSPGIKARLAAVSFLPFLPSAASDSVSPPAFLVMGFGDLKSASGLKVLNDFLSDRSYIEG